MVEYVILIKEPVRFQDWLSPEGEYDWRWAPAYSCGSLPEIGKEEAIAISVSDHYYVIKSRSTHLKVGDKIKRR